MNEDNKTRNLSRHQDFGVALARDSAALHRARRRNKLLLRQGRPESNTSQPRIRFSPGGTTVRLAGRIHTPGRFNRDLPTAGDRSKDSQAAAQHLYRSCGMDLLPTRQSLPADRPAPQPRECGVAGRLPRNRSGWEQEANRQRGSETARPFHWTPSSQPAQLYASMGDEQAGKTKADEIVSGLAKCQEAWLAAAILATFPTLPLPDRLRFIMEEQPLQWTAHFFLSTKSSPSPTCS